MMPLPEPLAWLWSKWVVAATLVTLFLFQDYEWDGA